MAFDSAGSRQRSCLRQNMAYKQSISACIRLYPATRASSFEQTHESRRAICSLIGDGNSPGLCMFFSSGNKSVFRPSNPETLCFVGERRFSPRRAQLASTLRGGFPVAHCYATVYAAAARLRFRLWRLLLRELPFQWTMTPRRVWRHDNAADKSAWGVRRCLRAIAAVAEPPTCCSSSSRGEREEKYAWHH